MGRRGRRRTPRQSRIWQIATIGAGAVVLALAAGLAVAPLFRNEPGPPDAAGSRTIVISMGGFAPAHLTIPAGQPATLVLVNPDSQFHTDGGGWHQFAIDALKIDARIPPHSQQTVTLGPLPAGSYEFYCDICCGGRSNPTMRGILEVAG